MRYFLYYHAGSGNHGCEAIVRATSKILNRPLELFSKCPDEDNAYDLEQLVEIAADTESTIPRKSLNWLLSALQIKATGSTVYNTKCRRRNFLDQVKAGDICLSIGGDNYCYAGVEQLSNLNLLLKRKGAKTVLWGCSIDPEAITPVMVKDLKRYDLITVRESLTQTALANAGVIENVRSVADPAFLLDAQETQLPEGFQPGNTIGLNLSPLILQYTDKKDEALSGFYALVQHILNTSDSVIALLPHVVKTGNNDLQVLEPIYEKFKDTGRVILVPDQNCMQLKYIISQCQRFIGARTHATIAAYSTGVPTLVIGYSVKSRGVATDLFGTDNHYVLPIQCIVSERDLVAAYEWFEAHADKIKQHLHQVIPAYKDKAQMGKVYLDELITNKS